MGCYEDALDRCMNAAALAPDLSACHSDAALCLVNLKRWDEAIKEALIAVRLGQPSLSTLDILSQSYGHVDQLDNTRIWGLRALNARMQVFGGPASIVHTAAPLPPPPSAATRERNVIAFSLFGNSAKYCEVAVLNVEARAQVYPDWSCHFYVDETVPAHVIARLDVPGSRVLVVPSEVRNWPGPMWRFLAYDTPDLHRVIFRDADSLSHCVKQMRFPTGSKVVIAFTTCAISKRILNF